MSRDHELANVFFPKTVHDSRNLQKVNVWKVQNATGCFLARLHSSIFFCKILYLVPKISNFICTGGSSIGMPVPVRCIQTQSFRRRNSGLIRDCRAEWASYGKCLWTSVAGKLYFWRYFCCLSCGSCTSLWKKDCLLCRRFLVLPVACRWLAMPSLFFALGAILKHCDRGRNSILLCSLYIEGLELE